MKKRIITKSDTTTILGRAKRGQYKEALEALAAAKGEIITPYDVLDEARNKRSPLHSAFTWDDSEAGEKYRLMEARILLNGVRVEYMGEQRPAYFNANVMIGKQQTRGYFPVERVMTDVDIHQAVLADAVRDLEHAQEKYNQLAELKGVINKRVLSKAKRKIRN